ncbi:hypothetical protein HID58_055760 [Brassica napus]|uniref:Uncharacterized protein n=1 Tax=Brassica napus TaxID=3708 RepID=A0ABQ8AMK4_BRANA|nr:hypothetical protein HID58_055760 [Brassica napus]
MVPKVGYHSYTDDTGVEVSRTGRDQYNHMLVQLAGELSDVMVELVGELTRVMVQLSGEWLLCRIRSFVHFQSFFQ